MDDLKQVILVKIDDSQEIISAEAFKLIVDSAKEPVNVQAEAPQEPKRGKRKNKTGN